MDEVLEVIAEEHVALVGEVHEEGSLADSLWRTCRTTMLPSKIANRAPTAQKSAPRLTGLGVPGSAGRLGCPLRMVTRLTRHAFGAVSGGQSLLGRKECCGVRLLVAGAVASHGLTLLRGFVRLLACGMGAAEGVYVLQSYLVHGAPPSLSVPHTSVARQLDPFRRSSLPRSDPAVAVFQA